MSCDIICGRNSVQLLSPNISKEFNEYYFGKKIVRQALTTMYQIKNH